MQSFEATIHCSNSSCQAPNPVDHHFCQQCSAVLLKRYLWAVGDVTSVPVGTLLLNRYWRIQGQVFLDAQPNLLPEAPGEIPAAVTAYLRLFACYPQVPQVYAVLPTKHYALAVVLLEAAPIYQVDDAAQGVTAGALMPALTAVWQSASALRQLHWLWQIAQLWEPLSQEQVASGLLKPEFLRVEGSLLRLLELSLDRSSPSLRDLAFCWRSWLGSARPEIAGFLAQLCEQVLNEQITTPTHLIATLDRAIAACAQTQQLQIQIATITDQGPTRQRNEDACFPASGSLLRFSSTDQRPGKPMATPLVIVCDGIGGHEGGNIASNLAIATIQQQLQPLLQSSSTQTSATLVTQLEQAALAANDVIAQRNDAENRLERQRMGTTLVMAMGCNHELYLTHVGDSRAYRITKLGCHQVTLDDDLAVREVRLGYTLYRHAVQQSGAGSLVQALGMSASSMLSPTVQRFVLDEDCVFLLCSDGLSDNDRVEQYWQTVITPLLEGTLNVATATQQLAAIANQQNGHDNVTVGLVHCRVMTDTLPLSSPLPNAMAIQPEPEEPRTRLMDAAIAPRSTKPLKGVPQPRQKRVTSWFGLLLLAGIGGLAIYVLATTTGLLNSEPMVSSQDPPSAAPSAVPTPPFNLPSPAVKSPLTTGGRVLVNRATPAGDGNAPIALAPRPTAAPVPNGSRSTVPVGSVLQVMSHQQDELNQRWLEVKVCSVTGTTSTNALSNATAEPGERGWVQEAAIAPFITANVSLTPAQLGTCQTARQPDRN